MDVLQDLVIVVLAVVLFGFITVVIELNNIVNILLERDESGQK